MKNVYVLKYELLVLNAYIKMGDDHFICFFVHYKK